MTEEWKICSSGDFIGEEDDTYFSDLNTNIALDDIQIEGDIELCRYDE